MPELNSENANLPQGEWNPPTGDADFDEIFGGPGDGSSDIIQVEEAQSKAVDQTTETTEPDTSAETTEATSQGVKQTTLKTDPETGYFVKTYRTKEETESALEHKDQLIENMRRMLESVTGQDPVKAIKSGQTGEISYLQDSKRYAYDKTRAAELGQKTGNWDAYRDVEAKFQRELMQRDLGPYLPVVQDVGRQKAVKAVASEIPDFEKFYESETYRQALEARPVLKNAISNGEKNGLPPQDLAELYKSAWDAGQTLKLPSLLRNNQQAPSNQNTRMPMSGTKLTPPAPTKTEAPPSLNTSAGRKAIMEEFARKGGLDRTF